MNIDKLTKNKAKQIIKIIDNKTIDIFTAVEANSPNIDTLNVFNGTTRFNTPRIPGRHGGIFTCCDQVKSAIKIKLIRENFR